MQSESLWIYSLCSKAWVWCRSPSSPSTAFSRAMCFSLPSQAVQHLGKGAGKEVMLQPINFSKAALHSTGDHSSLMPWLQMQASTNKEDRHLKVQKGAMHANCMQGGLWLTSLEETLSFWGCGRGNVTMGGRDSPPNSSQIWKSLDGHRNKEDSWVFTPQLCSVIINVFYAQGNVIPLACSL